VVCCCNGITAIQTLAVIISNKTMKNKKSILTGLFLIIMTSCTSDKLPIEFINLLDRARLTFTETDGMVETKCIENIQMNYEYALKYPDKNFEVRYAIRPMDTLLAQYEKARANGNLIIHPNKLSASAYKATLLNIGIGGLNSGVLPAITKFDSTAVKNEFNADWGMTAFVNLGKEFGGEIYKFCNVVIIHKDFIGDAYFFYLSDNKDFSNLMKKPFHSLKFK
jgi:hypothetical protein